MRTHFDAEKFLKLIDWRHKDFDIIYCHVPEHAAQIANVVYNNTHLRPRLIGYSHWFEVPENAPYERTMFDQAVLGTLELEELGVNSDWLKQLVLKYAAKTYQPHVVKQLDKIIQPHYLGVDTVRPRGDIWKNAVIFNHRDSAYTGWDWFVPAMDELWNRRRDFTVYTTLTQVDKPWNKRIKAPSRDGYLDLLQRMQFGVGCFEKYSAWSISTTDGLSVNTPYLMPAGLCYPEMVPSDYPYLYTGRDEFIRKFEDMLDHPPTYDTSPIAQGMLWENRIAHWFNGWDDVFDLTPVKNSKVVDELVELIKKNKSMTKFQLMKELNWGVQVKWTPYRNYLRQHPNITLYKNRYVYNE
jgi:hypothetical protein